MEIYFSEEEMKNFLIKLGYKIEIVNTWDTVTEYHNRVETKYYKSLIAYKHTKPKEDNKYQLESKYGFEVVFYKEFKKKLLK